MDSEIRNYIAKEGEIFISDFMTGDEDEEEEEQITTEVKKTKINGEEFNAMKAKFDFEKILTNLVIK